MEPSEIELPEILAFATILYSERHCLLTGDLERRKDGDRQLAGCQRQPK